MAKREWKKIGDHLYQRRGLIYWRSQAGGHRSWVRLESTNPQDARAEIGELIHKQTPSSGWIINILNFYLSCECPKRNEQPRTGRQLFMEVTRITRLLQFFRRHPTGTITHSTLRQYRLWRGDTRSCELDIAALAAACRWAYRNPDRTGITSNPMPTDRPRFAPPKKHCRDNQPTNAEQLHLIARTLMDNARSDVFGWMVLFLAFTGIRIGRALTFRTDSAHHEPGHHDGECIWVGISHSHKGVFPFIRMHDALNQWWDGFVEWRKVKDIDSPWYFPSPENPDQHVGNQSLEHAMRRTCKRLGIPKSSPHGLRSYYVNVLRSQGIHDAEIALRIGHKSGGKLIVDVYGEIMPHVLTFIPSGEPAWKMVTTLVTTSGQNSHNENL